LTLNNVAPSNLKLTLAPTPLYEGDSASLSGQFADPGPLDPHTVAITWGDGSPDTTLHLAPGVVIFTAPLHVYRDNLQSNAPYTISATVTDGDNATTSGSIAAPVQNAAPHFQNVQVTSPINEGGTTTLTGTFTDAGILNTHTATIDWGDGTSPEPGNVAEAPFGPPGSSSGMNGTVAGSHVYAKDGVYLVTVAVNDNHGGVGSGSFHVTARNVALDYVLATQGPWLPV
jgi:hypothetical protein